MIQLHDHSDYSNLRLVDSIVKLKALIYKAVELGNKGVAITDHESVSGHVDAIKIVKEGKSKGNIPEDFKLILGNEIYLVDSLEEVKDNYKPGITKFWHFILLAKDKEGHRQLRELSSLAWDNSFKTGIMERTPTLKADLEQIVRKNPGHLIASSACLGGELPQWILENNINKLNEFLDFCYGLFGCDFYLEMQPNDSEEQITVNKTIVSIAEQCNLPFIVTCDTHYLNKENRIFHEAFLKSHEEEREVGDFYKTTYMMSEEEIHKYLDFQIGKENTEKAISMTDHIGACIKDYDLFHPTIVPDADIPEFKVNHIFKEFYNQYPYIEKFAYSKNDYDRYLLYLIEIGFREKGWYVGISDEECHNLISRIEVELSEMWQVTEKINTSISSYYLSTLELIDIMWDEGDSLVGVARGSVTGMYTMYLIGLIQMNPVKWGLPHWRHISHQKAELSDVDIDTQRNRRSQILEAVKKRKGERRVLNCCTFKTEGSKSAVLTAARGLDIDNDIAQYIANMIPITRGFTWSLKDCLEGNVEEERAPITEFINEIKKIPNLLETALSIEGLINGRSIHASAVYIFNEDFIEHNARMKAPNGTYITQYNMKCSDYMSGLKMDFLTISSLDSIRHCMDLLIKSGYMEWQGTLRDTYNKYLHPDVLDYDTKEMWDWVSENKVMDLFQFDTPVGLQAARRIKPHSLIELAAANSIMRLMVSEPGAEQPMDTYIRYKDDISQWYSCMRDEYHLTEKEIKILEPYLLPVYGVGDTQEIVMKLSMDEHISGFDVAQSNKLRKGISKKDKDLQAEMKKMFFKHGKELNTSENLLNYIWKEVIGKQLGYSFSLNHTMPYSCIGLQELNLAYHYPIIFWNTACLIVNAGADEQVEENKSTDYGKIATAISNIQARGENIALPLINSADFGFIPDVKNNRIIYSLKAINGIGDDVVRTLIKNRPYVSMEDFYQRMIETKEIKTSQMIQLIKSGCFTELHSSNREDTMMEFLCKYVIKPVEKLTLAQFERLIEFDQKYKFIPESIHLAIAHKHFKDYVLEDTFIFKHYINSGKKVPKAGYHDRWFKLDDTSMGFFKKYYSEGSVEAVDGEYYVISEKKFIKENNNQLEMLRNWLSNNEVIKKYNECLLLEAKEKYSEGSIAKWEMDSLSIYCTQEHELKGINKKYGIVNFFEEPEIPQVYDFYSRYIKQSDGTVIKQDYPKNKIVRIAGTILDKNKDRHMITLLTPDGVVTAKFNKGQFAFYDRQISEVNENGNKTVQEKSWFTRGNKVILCGHRSENQFIAKKYTDTVWKHTCNLISDIYSDGTIKVVMERGE